MAVVKLVSGKEMVISHERALEIWGVLTGETDATPEQDKFCLGVHTVVFNWRHAPEDWIKRYLSSLIPIVTSSWMVDRRGRFTRPEPKDEAAWHFAKRWGLWENGRATSIVPGRA